MFLDLYIIYMKEKTEGFLIVTGLYPNETGRQQKEKERSTRPAPFKVNNLT